MIHRVLTLALGVGALAAATDQGLAEGKANYASQQGIPYPKIYGVASSLGPLMPTSRRLRNRSALFSMNMIRRMALLPGSAKQALLLPVLSQAACMFAGNLAPAGTALVEPVQLWEAVTGANSIGRVHGTLAFRECIHHKGHALARGGCSSTVTPSAAPRCPETLRPRLNSGDPVLGRLYCRPCRHRSPRAPRPLYFNSATCCSVRARSKNFTSSMIPVAATSPGRAPIHNGKSVAASGPARAPSASFLPST